MSVNVVLFYYQRSKGRSPLEFPRVFQDAEDLAAIKAATEKTFGKPDDVELFHGIDVDPEGPRFEAEVKSLASQGRKQSSPV